MKQESIEGFAKDSATGATGRILVVDDEKNIRSTLKMVLHGEGFVADLAADGAEAEKFFALTPPDVVLLDVRLPGRTGLELLAQWKVQYAATPIILMSGEATLTEALDGLKNGAYDFLEKPLIQPRVLNAVLRALEKRNLTDDMVQSEDHIIGNSTPLKALLADVAKLAPLKTRVLITGESGTGKDLIARAIHQLSARSKKRFVKINCAAIPSELIESELFGHVKGAFTGAIAARKGHFEMANGGTLFLDEVGELSASAQAKILRALQNGEITPVGSDLTIKVDVRVVSATNRDLKAEVELGQFREDLYYRLAVVTLECPPLRARADDIPLITRHLAEFIRQENGLGPKTFAPEVLHALTSYPWPGNIRELRNAIERLMILSGPLVGLEHLPQEIAKGKVSGGQSAADTQGFKVKTWEAFKMESEREFLIQTLRKCQGSISETARVLAVERTTIHKWLKHLQIEKQHYLV